MQNQIEIKNLIMKIVAISLCVVGFVYEIKGVENLHILYCIILTVATFCSIILLSIPDVAEKTFKAEIEKHPNLLKTGINVKNPTHIFSQITIGIQVLLCGYYGAWIRVILLILSSIFVFIMNVKIQSMYEEYIKNEKIKNDIKEEMKRNPMPEGLSSVFNPEKYN